MEVVIEKRKRKSIVEVSRGIKEEEGDKEEKLLPLVGRVQWLVTSSGNVAMGSC